MRNRKIICAIIVLSFLMSAPSTPGRTPLEPGTVAEGTQSVHPFEFNRQSIVVAQNEPQATEGGSQKKSESQDQSSDSGAAARDNGSNSSNDAASKPLKPFKPSEEIAAEQAVDFPVDI